MESIAPSEMGSSVNEQVQERQLHGWALASVLAGLMLTMLMAALDQTVVDTAIPRIIGELHGFNLYSWLITIYLLASTTTIPIVGKLSDQFGRKWLMILGISLFLIGSVLSGAAQTMTQLIIFRGVQGLGAGFLQTLILTLIADIFPPRERARWQGLIFSVFAVASVIGPTVGGWITDTLSWRWVFYVNIPVGVLALIVIVIWLPSAISQATTQVRGWAIFRRVDIAGAFVIAAGTICLLLFLSWGGQTYPWNSPQVIGLGVAAAICFVLFFFIETRVHEPILPLGLFRNRVFTVGALLSLVQGMAMFAVIVYMPLFLQGVMGRNATSSGAVTTPVSITMVVVSSLSGLIISKLGRYQIVSIVGAVFMCISMFLLTLMTSAVPLWNVIINMVLVGVGLGTLFPILSLATQNSVPREQLGVGTGAVTFLRSMGSTLATAVLGTLVSTTYNQYITDHLPAVAKRLPAGFRNAVTDQQVLTNLAYREAIVKKANEVAVQSANVPAGPQHNDIITTITHNTNALLSQIFGVVREALAGGIHLAFVSALVLAGVILLLTFFLRDVPMDKAPAGRSDTNAAASGPVQDGKQPVAAKGA